MNEHLAEGLVYIDNSRVLIEHICASLSQLYQSISYEGQDCILDFGEGRSTFRSSHRELWFRIVAQNVLVFYGIKTAIEVGLARSSKIPPEINWLHGNEIPFEAIERFKSERRAG